METATMTELDGTPILEYSVGPHGDHRGILTIAAFVICLDLAFQLAFLAPNWDSFAQVGFLPTMLLGLLRGPLAVLVPVAFVLRSLDAWQVRRFILLGMLLSVANVLGQRGEFVAYRTQHLADGVGPRIGPARAHSTLLTSTRRPGR